MKKILLTAAAAALLTAFMPAMPASSLAAERTVLSLSGANFRPIPLAIARPTSEDKGAASASMTTEISFALENDLALSGIFELLDKRSFLADPGEGRTASEIKFSRWQDVGAEMLLKVHVKGISNAAVQVEYKLFNVGLAQEELSRTFSVPASDIRRTAHAFADELYTHYTRER